MKTKKNKLIQRMPLTCLSFILILGFSIISMTGCSQQNDDGVMKAYDLRMQGKVDDALTLVDSLITLDPGNALAHYERYRILNYMMKGGAEVSVDDLLESIGSAAEYDSDNVDFALAKANASFLGAYISMQQGQDDASMVVAICDEFEAVLSLDPDHPQALLYLVDINSQLPAEMGGDSVKAVYYADLLSKNNGYYAAKAELLVNPQDAVEFWLKYLDTHETSPEILKEVGTAYVYEEDPENAFKYYAKAMSLDPDLNTLLLDQARYYMYMVMYGMAEGDSVLPIAATYINQYLESDPKPIVPLKAYAMGMLAKTKMFTGQKEEGKELLEQAKALDPYFSKAMGIPGPSIFDPPNNLSPRYSSFFEPF